MEHLIPYILAAMFTLLTGWLTWLSVQTIQGKIDIARLQTTIEIYLDTKGKGAARLLDSPNPTPPRLRELLRKYRRNELTESERLELLKWLKEFVKAQEVSKSERSAANEILAIIQAHEAARKQLGWKLLHFFSS